jgi:vacuolar-type H+-ATPase subunit D/Vma8
VSRWIVRWTATAIAEERTRALEAEIADLKGRVNGLIFVLIGTVATQVIMRLFG